MRTLEISSLKQLDALALLISGDRTIAIDAALKAGAVIGEASIAAGLRGMLSGSSTGELLGAFGISPIKESILNYDRNVKVGFNEPRRKQYPATKNLRGRIGKKYDRRMGRRSYGEITNEMISNVIEHGVQNSNQPARPWNRPAVRRAKQSIVSEAEKAFENTLEKALAEF
jgi:hypothetical protein